MDFTEAVEQRIQVANKTLQKIHCPHCGAGAGPFQVLNRLQRHIYGFYCSIWCARGESAVIGEPVLHNMDIQCRAPYWRFLGNIKIQNKSLWMYMKKK